MKMKRIANNVALQTIGYVISRIPERVYLRSGMRLSEAGHLQGLV